MTAQMAANRKQLKWFTTKGVEASRLRKRKFTLVRKYGFDQNLLSASMCRSYRRCGKIGCHCNKDKGHPKWSLTFSVQGKKYVESIPVGWVPELEALVADGREYQQALREMLAINAELLRLYRQQERKRRPQKSTFRRPKRKKVAKSRKKRSPP